MYRERRTDMKNYTRHIICLCLSLLLLLSLPVLSFADAPAKDNDDASWSISESGDLLCYGEERYLPLELSNDYFNLSDFSKEGTVLWGEQEMGVAVSFDNADLVVLYKDSMDVVGGNCKNFYYKEEVISKARALLEGPITNYKLNDSYYISDVESALIKEILSRLSDKGETVDVSKLDDVEQYELLGYFKKGLPTKRIGVFLDSEQGCYYVSYKGLTNSHFTADGALSTREGEVTAVLLTDEESQALKEALEDYTFTNPSINEDFPPFIYYLFLFIGIASFGFFTPLAILIFSAVMLIRRKTLHPVRYVALALLSILWILLALLITLLLLI